MGSVTCLAAGIALLGSGCTLFRTDVTECEVDTDCRTAFGLGSVCDSGGLCSEQQRLDRCELTFPDTTGGLFEQDPDQLGSVVVFGSIMDRSVGLFSAFEKSLRLALEQANDEGGSDGRTFGIVFCDIAEDGYDDGLTSAEAALAAADYLAGPVGVPAIFGPATSGDTQAVFQQLSEAGADVLVISPSATSPALTGLDPARVDDDQPGLLWRTAPPDSLQGAAISIDMSLPGTGRAAAVTSVAVISEAGPYGDGLAQVFADEFRAADGEVTPFRFETAGQRDTFVTEAGQGAFEEILFVSSDVDDIVDFLDVAAADANYDGRGIFLTDAAATSSVIGVGSPARYAQVRGTRPKPLDEDTDLVYATFLASFLAAYDEDADDQVFTANSYDAGWMLAYGATWALFNEDSVLTGTTLARGLRRLSAGETINVGPTTWNQVLQKFRAGEQFDVAGASGPLDFDPASEETTADVEVWTISGSTIVGAYTVTP